MGKGYAEGPAAEEAEAALERGDHLARPAAAIVRRVVLGSTRDDPIQHVLGQTTVRVCGTPHAETYAALLPHTMNAMLERAPVQMAQLAAAVGATPATLAMRLDELGGGTRIDLDPDQRRLVVETALARPELADTPGPPVTAADLEALLEAAASR